MRSRDAGMILLLFGLAWGAFRPLFELRRAQAKSSSATLPEGTYPLTEAETHAMAARGDLNEIRAHGWAILKKLVADQPGSDPVNSAYPGQWDVDSWDNKCTLGLASNLCGGVAPASLGCDGTSSAPKRVLLEGAVQTVFTDSATGQAKFAGIASVLYSPLAGKFIRKHCLATLDGLKKVARDGAQFETGAVVVKLIWALPRKGNKLGVWQNSMANNPPLETVGLPFTPGSTWFAVTVNPDIHAECGNSSYRMTNAAGYDETADAVPINCFYHRRFLCKDIAPQQAAEFFDIHVCNGTSDSVDAMLIGVHIITAEQREWVWNTFWWTPNPEADARYHGDAPKWIQGRGAWRFYSMTSTMSKTTPVEADGLAHIAFNPYLEGPKPHGTVSNCMYCHEMAVIRDGDPKKQPSAVDEFGAGMPPRCGYHDPLTDTCRMQMLKEAPTPQPGGWLLRNDSRYFEGATSTHFLWSLADAHDEKARNTVTMNLLLPPSEMGRKIPLPPNNVPGQAPSNKLHP